MFLSEKKKKKNSWAQIMTCNGQPKLVSFVHLPWRWYKVYMDRKLWTYQLEFVSKISESCTIQLRVRGRYGIWEKLTD